jgi:hypothetical protein
MVSAADSGGRTAVSENRATVITGAQEQIGPGRGAFPSSFRDSGTPRSHGLLSERAAAIAVGTALRRGLGPPPHRSEHAELPHSAPASGSIVEAVPRVWVKDTGSRDPVVSQALHSLPCHAAPLTPAPKRMEPVAGDLDAEAAHAAPVRRNRVIREVAANDGADPLALYGDR